MRCHSAAGTTNTSRHPSIGKCLCVSLFAVVLWTAAAFPTATAAQQASVTGGTVEGVIANGVASFKGIPFAAPPVGSLRWKPPQPVVPWSGVRKAEAFASPCAQGSGADRQGGEDCLYLNVWTAASSPTERRPVMVWIHGGAFNGGATSYFDGTRFAQQGVVFVSIAYRLGVFGFLAHPELSRESGKASGSYGLQDQSAALAWVKENIGQFAGDTSRITVFGESAGGIAVNLLAAAPAAKGLFHRAISQSGAVFREARETREQDSGPLLTLKFAEATGQGLLKRLGAADIRAARSIPVERLLDAAVKYWFWAVLDGDVLRGTNDELYQAGRFSDIPILIGFNSDDRHGDVPPAASASVEQLARAVPARCRAQADAVVATYSHATPAEGFKALARDVGYGRNTWAWAQWHARKAKGAVYLYYFDVRTPDSPDGAPHGADIPYVFGNFDAAPRSEDVHISDLMRHYWINFATTGDPNGPGLSLWPRFNERTQDTMIFDRSPSARPLPNVKGMNAIDSYFRCTRHRHVESKGTAGR